MGAAGALALGCRADVISAPGLGELDIRAHGPTDLIGPGTHEIDVGDILRKIQLHVPPSVDGSVPAPLALLFHGATGKGIDMVEAFAPMADAAGMILVAPDALYVTWDALSGPFGADLDFAAEALDVAFDRCRVDPKRIGIAGYSDGATYAIALGRASGRLISRVAAFSAGFLLDVDPKGRPDFFLSHGTTDPVLPIDLTGRVVSAQLATAYDVQYVEFDGGHMVPPTIAWTALPWLAAPRA
jgi:phospholipase/carboxylesterase